LDSARTHLTAISRKKLSAPVKYLKDEGFLVGEILDYGCGRGFDCDFLECDGYDPHYRPQPLTRKYDTVFCVYVLNVLPTDEERFEVINEVRKLLKEHGRAYFVVRNDKKSLNGWTSKGTYQTFVDLPFPVIKKTTGYLIYSLPY
jgi:SAM-dependent methyltransferase